MSGLSPYFEQSANARAWLDTDGGRLSEATYALWVAIINAMHLPQIVKWLNRKLTRKAQR
jgi:hypothetical protein